MEEPLLPERAPVAPQRRERAQGPLNPGRAHLVRKPRLEERARKPQDQERATAFDDDHEAEQAQGQAKPNQTRTKQHYHQHGGELVWAQRVRHRAQRKTRGRRQR